MRIWVFGAGLVLLTFTTAAHAQQASLGAPVSVPPPTMVSEPPPPRPQPVLPDGNGYPPPTGYPGGKLTLPDDYRYPPSTQVRTNPPSMMENPSGAWVSVDYLLWWVKPGPNPNPLVTVGSENDSIAGALGQPNTRVLFGEHNVDFGSMSGVRLSAGWWLPPCLNFAVEGSFFILQRGSARFSAFSDSNGSPVVARPIINAQTSKESSYIDSYSGVAIGGADVCFTTELNGFELNLAANMYRLSNFEWDMLGGFRAVNLVEDLQIRDVFVPLVPGNFTFLGNAADPPNALGDFDRFHTSNHFYGGQIGSRLTWTAGRLDAAWTNKVALGVTQQAITVDGTSMQFISGSLPAVATGGVFAQPSNMGRASRSVLSVVPETGLNVGCQVAPWLRVQFGYSFLYWSNVVRPGNQIDRAVNPTQVPTDQSYGTLSGPARPVLTPQTGDFWTQGINFGVEFRF